MGLLSSNIEKERQLPTTARVYYAS
jgi:hypothetical protein